MAAGIAAALRDAGARQQLHDDLRDSPFNEHAIDLGSYLRGARGGIADRAAQALGLSRIQFIALVARIGGVEVVMERSIDRLVWDGIADVVVFGTSRSFAARMKAPVAQIAYRADGRTTTLPIYEFAHFPIVALRPAEVSYGDDPEAVRLSAPRLTRQSISTRDAEFEITRRMERRGGSAVNDDTPCDPAVNDYCDTVINGTEGPSGYQLPTQYTQYYCFGTGTGLPAESDADGDGIRDECESLLATSFMPQLMYAGSDPNMGMEPWFSVAPRQPSMPGFGYPSTIKIFYALSYHRDPGSPVGSIEAHDGDSEFIIVGLHNPTGAYWTVDYVTMSAHYGAGSADHTATYGTDVLEWGDIPRGRPRVWVSWGKHANYRSRVVCINTWNDFCGYEYAYLSEIPTMPSTANLGNYWAGTGDGRLVTCNTSRYGAFPGTECGWWDNQPFTSGLGHYFAGWHPYNGTAATAYGVPLFAFGF